MAWLYIDMINFLHVNLLNVSPIKPFKPIQIVFAILVKFEKNVSHCFVIHSV